MKNKKIISIIAGTILVTTIALSFILLNNSKTTSKLSNKCSDGFCDEKEQTNPDLCSEDCKTVKTSDNQFGVNDSPFGILTALYPPKRTEKMHRPTEYHWDISKNDNPPFSTVNDLGLSWDRGTHPILDWSYVQKNVDMITNNKFDWSVSDNYIKQLPSNMNFLITLDAGTLAIPLGQWEFRSKTFKKAYTIFVQKAVERYDGDGIDDMPGLKIKVKYWQIENEPVSYINLKKTKNPNNDYRGYAELLKIAYNSIKTSDPKAQVLSAGMVSQPEPRNTEILNGFWTPLIKELNGSYIDIFDFHWFEKWDKIGNQFYKIRTLLNDNGFKNTDIWMTENGKSSKYGLKDKNGIIIENGEQFQASDLTKRLFFPLTLGVKKTFWAWGLVEGFPPFNCQSKFDYTGLIYDGYCKGDLGYGTKKLSYYSLKLLNEKLKYLYLENIQKIAESDDIYVYKLTNKETEKSTWIAWSDSESGSIDLSTLGITTAKVTEAVPKYDNGKQIQDSNVGFDDMFKEYTTSGSVKLSDGPVYIENN